MTVKSSNIPSGLKPPKMRKKKRKRDNIDKIVTTLIKKGVARNVA